MHATVTDTSGTLPFQSSVKAGAAAVLLGGDERPAAVAFRLRGQTPCSLPRKPNRPHRRDVKKESSGFRHWSTRNSEDPQWHPQPQVRADPAPQEECVKAEKAERDSAAQLERSQKGLVLKHISLKSF